MAHKTWFGTTWKYRIQVGMVDSDGTTLGLRKCMHKQYSRLVQVKASKRLGSDQLESDNSHQHALILTNIECKHEQDINHHEHKYRGGYIDFVSATCINMCQVKPLESFRGGYHPIILHHNHFNMHVGTQEKPLSTLS